MWEAEGKHRHENSGRDVAGRKQTSTKAMDRMVSRLYSVSAQTRARPLAMPSKTSLEENGVPIGGELCADL